ncbi:Fic/DOC family protein [Ruminococcus flavefaciens]|uniref:protein adenylyltransferase n=1 Tax=Ruminococcus flavefaciens TaxID=1265 RepID=A0A1M7JBE7_RUMFL|nr:Fic family protein [Ruminococcus flavefaciens]SHM50325.1 cell filamentation protein [Ruminococcus flavefaciens]
MAVYSIEGCNDSCYPDTTVLVNKLDIREQELLNEAESIIVTSCSVKAEKELDFKDVDFEYYKGLHKLIFGDLYEWAGTVRTINISKKGTVFCDHNELERLGRLRFERLRARDFFRDMEYDEFVSEVSELYHELNMLHPFREGNGRTLRLFVTLLVRNAEYDIDFALCDPDMLAIANIKAAQGDISLLKAVFADMIKNDTP